MPCDEKSSSTESYPLLVFVHGGCVTHVESASYVVFDHDTMKDDVAYRSSMLEYARELLNISDLPAGHRKCLMEFLADYPEEPFVNSGTGI